MIIENRFKVKLFFYGGLSLLFIAIVVAGYGLEKKVGYLDNKVSMVRNALPCPAGVASTLLNLAAFWMLDVVYAFFRTKQEKENFFVEPKLITFLFASTENRE